MTHDILYKLVEAFGAVEDRPGYWKAKCPIHDDHKASLEIWVRNDHVVFGCWACTYNTPDAKSIKKRMLAAVGLTWKDVMEITEDKPARRKVVKTYDYRDEDGKLLYQVVRYEPKDFRQRQPRGRDWQYNLDGVRRVLYRLPELISSQHGRPGFPPIFVVEGEKDADNLCRVGLMATTRCGGAKAPWLPEYSATLRGRDVVIIPDNDPAGLDGAACVAGKLLVGMAASVCVHRLQGLPDGGKDVSDWLAARDSSRPTIQTELLRQVYASPRFVRKAG